MRYNKKNNFLEQFDDLSEDDEYKSYEEEDSWLKFDESKEPKGEKNQKMHKKGYMVFFLFIPKRKKNENSN